MTSPITRLPAPTTSRGPSRGPRSQTEAVFDAVLRAADRGYASRGQAARGPAAAGSAFSPADARNRRGHEQPGAHALRERREHGRADRRQLKAASRADEANGGEARAEGASGTAADPVSDSDETDAADAAATASAHGGGAASAASPPEEGRTAAVTADTSVTVPETLDAAGQTGGVRGDGAGRTTAAAEARTTEETATTEDATVATATPAAEEETASDGADSTTPRTGSSTAGQPAGTDEAGDEAGAGVGASTEPATPDGVPTTTEADGVTGTSSASTTAPGDRVARPSSEPAAAGTTGAIPGADGAAAVEHIPSAASSADAAGPAVNPAKTEPVAPPRAEPTADPQHTEAAVEPNVGTARPGGDIGATSVKFAGSTHRVTVDRIVALVEQLRNAPPPRTMTVDLEALGGVRLVVSLRGDAVSISTIGGQELDTGFAGDLSESLTERGFSFDRERGDGEGAHGSGTERSFSEPDNGRLASRRIRSSRIDADTVRL